MTDKTRRKMMDWKRVFVRLKKCETGQATVKEIADYEREAGTELNHFLHERDAMEVHAIGKLTGYLFSRRKMKRKPVRLKRRPKYGSQRTVYKGVTYASKLEVDTAAWLDLMVKAREVTKWWRQPRFNLFADAYQGLRRYIGHYTADFRVTFTDRHEEIWECKSAPTRTALYRLKLKIFKANYPNLIHREITREDLPRILR